MCKQYVGTAYMLLMNKQAQAEVLAEMKSACSLLPASAQGAVSHRVLFTLLDRFICLYFQMHEGAKGDKQ